MEIIILFGSILIVFIAFSINSSNNKRKSDAFFENLKKETEDLRKQNEYDSMVREFYFEFFRNGKRYESDNNYSKAIEKYRLGLDYAVKEPTLKINNFAKSIHRLIILYGKTKQYEDLKNLLEESISNYPDYRDVGDWKTRLEKLNTKLNNQ